MSNAELGLELYPSVDPKLVNPFTHAISSRFIDYFRHAEVVKKVLQPDASGIFYAFDCPVLPIKNDDAVAECVGADATLAIVDDMRNWLLTGGKLSKITLCVLAELFIQAEDAAKHRKETMSQSAPYRGIDPNKNAPYQTLRVALGAKGLGTSIINEHTLWVSPLERTALNAQEISDADKYVLRQAERYSGTFGWWNARVINMMPEDSVVA